jgi:hypothetical protein
MNKVEVVVLVWCRMDAVHFLVVVVVVVLFFFFVERGWLELE